MRQYLPALKAHLLFKRTVPRDRVEDILQGFVVDKVVEHHLLSRATRKKGKFRTFLLTVLDRYVIDQQRRENAQRRRPDRGWAANGQDCADDGCEAACAVDPFEVE